MEKEKLSASQRDELPENKLKQYNYAEQKTRLNKAMKYEFYLEATFIEYAIVKDRIESFLRHSDVFNPDKRNTFVMHTL